MTGMTCCSSSHGQKRSYLVHLIDTQTSRWGKCIVQSSCLCDIQQWVESMAVGGQLVVHDPNRNDEPFVMLSPQVMHIDDKSAAHIPLVDPVN